jgi:hypothetical protein
MDRVRYVLGFIVGAFLMASAFLHSILGWRALSGQLVQAGAPSELIENLALGWHLAGAAMFTLGCILILVFGRFLRDRSSSLRIALLVALLYVGFGTWAFVVSRNPFFAVTFIAPGVLLLVASARSSTPARA